MAEARDNDLIQDLLTLAREISSFSDFREPFKKHFVNLARRLRLLVPMFEELRDGNDSIPVDAVGVLVSLKDALAVACDLLRLGCEGSKIYLGLEGERITRRFQDVTVRLEQALAGICYDELRISDEVKEQVELVHAQFQRAKGRFEAPETEPYRDLLSAYSKLDDLDIDPSIFGRIAEKLQLMTLPDLKNESLALHEMVTVSGGDPGAIIEKMAMLLKKIKEFVQTENPGLDGPDCDESIPLGGYMQTQSKRSPVVPDDYRCPISLELMKDPVIVSTGQTYERSCIEKWLEAGHRTCPKTQQMLTTMTLTPNYALRSLIEQWCEANGVELPKRHGASHSNKALSSYSLEERFKIDALVRKLSSSNPEDQLSAACELRLLAKRNGDNRVSIAEAGAIPLLVGLLTTSDLCTQEHVVTALLNLSICGENKGAIVSAGAIPGVVHVLKNGSMEARENAAATLFSLSVVDENKVTIGASGAIPALVTLLNEGSQRGKKDAATALFNLCIYQGNKARAVRARVVITLMRLVSEPSEGMVDEALAILAILAGHSEGKAAIGAADAVPVLVDVIKSGSPRNKENAAAVLVHLCSGDHQCLGRAQELGLMPSILDLAQNGTERGKRKAMQLLERLSRHMEQQDAL